MFSQLRLLTLLLCLFTGGTVGTRASTNWFLDADGVWQTSTNWNPSTVPNAADGTVILGAIISADRTIRLGANAKMGHLTIANANDYQVSGLYDLQFDVLSSPSASLNVSGGGSPLITANITLLDHLVITQNSSGSLRLGGNIKVSSKSLTKQGSGVLELTGINSFGGGLFINAGTVRTYTETALGNGTNNITINGGALNIGADYVADGVRGYAIGSSGGALNIDGGATLTLGSALLRGSGAMTKSGAGTLLLQGDHSSTFSGSVTIAAGTLSISAENNLGALGNDVTLNGGILEVTSGFTASSGKVFTFGSNGGALDVANNQTLTLGTAGQISGSGVFNKSGEGTLVLSGNNSGSFTGNTFINDGTIRITAENNLGALANDVTLNGGALNIGGSFTASSGKTFTMGANDGTIEIDNGQTLTVATSSQLLGSGDLNVTGLGTLAVTAAQNSFAGNIVVSGATLSFGGSGGTATGVGQITVADRGTLLLANQSNNDNRLSANIVLNGGTIRMTSDENSAEVLGTLTLAGGGSYVEIDREGKTPVMTFAGFSRTDESTVHFANLGDKTLGASGNNNPKISFTSGNAPALNDGILGGWATAQSSSSGSLEFATLTDGLNVSALTDYNSGSMATMNVKPESDVSLGTNTTVNSAVLTAGRSGDLNGYTLTIDSGGLIAQGTGSISDGTLTVGPSGTGGTLFAHVAPSGTLTISAAIADNGVGVVNLVKANHGTLILGQTNSYSGSTFVNGGTLRLGTAGAIPDESPVTVAVGAIFDLASFNEKVGPLSGGGSVTLGSGRLRAGAGGGSSEFSGTITGTGELFKVGSGTLTLSGQNTFSGGLAIKNGTVAVSEAGNLGTGANEIILDGGTLSSTESFTFSNPVDVAGPGAISVAPSTTLTLTSPTQLSGAGTLTKGGAGTLNLAGGTGFTGDLVIDGGNVRVAGTSSDVDAFLTSTRLENLSGLGGTLTLGYSNSNVTNTVSAMPSSPSNIKLGFDVSGGATGVSYIIGPADNELNWAGLVIDGGSVQLGHDHTLVGTSATTLEMNGGSLYLAGQDLAGGKTLEISGTATLAGGKIFGGPGGGSHGTLKTSGNIDSSGTILVNGPNIVMVANGPATTTTLSGTTPLNGVFNFNKQGQGTVILQQSMTVSDLLTIEQGTLLLGGNERLNDTASIVLGNGTFATGGFSEHVGTLTLLSDATLDLGSGEGSTLAFENSADKWGSFTLTINNYFDDTEEIYFGTTSSGLSEAQLNQVRWVDPYGPGSGTAFGTIILPNGRIRPVPVPEPKTVISVILLASILGWRERKTVVKGLSAVKKRLVHGLGTVGKAD